MAIDYARMQKSNPKLKAMLTRAQKKADPKERYLAVKAACKAAVTEWEAVGAWVDNWSHWQRALDDAAFHYVRECRDFTVNTLQRLETL